MLGMLSGTLFASDASSAQMFNKSFLIVKSTKIYDEAKAFALQLSIKSGIKTDFRALVEEPTFGLSEEKQVCQEQGFDFPCYIARGRYDDGVYISVEYSNAYSGFAKGYYIVMLASGDDSKKVLAQIKKLVPDAYVKQSTVYMGCIH